MGEPGTLPAPTRIVKTRIVGIYRKIAQTVQIPLPDRVEEHTLFVVVQSWAVWVVCCAWLGIADLLRADR
jgi:hypothetical protein